MSCGGRVAKISLKKGDFVNVAQLRDYMAEKVIPEKVMPQNIAEFLMDEEAELPELNAFTFLNRLRSLGIGSADFLYLLEGCGAPSEAIERIRRNPAMNLQSLIITLDSSGLTSQDYTRMLYTARQMWERTLTMRLENMVPKALPQDDDPFVDTAEIELDTVEADNIRNHGAIPGERESEDETTRQTESHTDYTSEMTAVETEEYPEPEDDPELLAAMAYYKNIFSPAAEESGVSDDEHSDIPSAVSDTSDEFSEQPQTEDIGYGSEADRTADTEEAAEAYYSAETPDGNAESSFGEYNGGTSDESPDEEYDEFEGTSEFVQIDADAVMRELTSVLDEDEPSQPEPVRMRREGGYHKAALISSAAGAALVFAASAAASAMGFEPESVPVLKYAAEYIDIFAQTLTSYNADILGGKPFESHNSGEILGGLLIEPFEPADELGVFNTDVYVYAAETDGIAVYKRGDSLTACGTLCPPENTEFIRVFEQDGAVFAVFSGKNCGFMKIDNEAPLYISEQDGILTDIVIENGCIRLGSVYVPEFTEDFSAVQIEKYIPETGTAGVIPAENVLLSGEGCGYAVSAAYDTANGSVISSGAVMGRAVYSAADGALAALEYGDGFLLAAISEEIKTETVGELIGCARAGELLATAELGENGIEIYLRGADLKPLSVIKNLSGEVRSLSFSGSTLLVNGDSGTFAAIDCNDAENPKPLDLTKKTGAVKDGLALCGELSGTLLTYTLYNKDGAVSSYSVTLSEKELSTLDMGGINTFIIEPGRSGFAFDCFDGVCKVSRYIIFGQSGAEHTLFDDKTGFTAAAELDGNIYLIYGGGAMPIE